jgi:hypothetical protein
MATKYQLKAHLRGCAERSKRQSVAYESFISESPVPCAEEAVALTRKNSKYLQCAVSHMHNGNREAYEKYKRLMVDALSETLDSMMDQPELSLLGGDSACSKNEGAVVAFGKRSKRQYEALLNYEERADALGLWK